jgi:hypothetical protein
MRKIITALALAGASTFAAANGVYDGVYQTLGRPGYVVIMQNGTTLGVAAMGQMNNASTVRWGSATTGYVTPGQVSIWEAYLGPIAGAQATVTGTTDYGACTSTTSITFDGAGNMTVQTQSSTPTALGTASGYNCWPAGSGASLSFTRVF